MHRVSTSSGLYFLIIKEVGQQSAGGSIDILSQCLDGNPRAKNIYITSRRKSESEKYLYDVSTEIREKKTFI
jgi:hypothetical protein